MRGTALVSLLYLGCYSAEPRAGLPCDPVTRACPAGQQCVDSASGSVCVDPSTIVADAAVGEDDAPIDSAVDGVAIDAIMHVEAMAVIADCLNPAAPDPDACITANGAGQLVIDADDSSTNNPWNGYVRFDLDGTIAGRTVMAVSLRMVATTDAKAPGTNTGSVWQVAPFTRQSLFTTTPAQMGSVLAGSQGSVAQNEVITWPLPTSLVAANASVYLGITSSSSDGVNYWSSTGTTPPRLVIDLE